MKRTDFEFNMLRLLLTLLVTVLIGNIDLMAADQNAKKQTSANKTDLSLIHI